MEIDLIKRQLEQVFDGPAWHGPSVMETLNKVTLAQAANSYGNSHSLIEIIGHMAVWRNFVISRLKGNNDFEVSDEMNFPRLTDLPAAIATLKATQHDLVKYISDFPEERLAEKVSGRTYTFQTLLHGIVQHDLYHLGQIVLLTR